MVESSLTKRQQIKQNLINLADENITKFSELKLVMEDTNIGYEARQTWQGDGPVTVIKYKAQGFTKEHWMKWSEDPVDVQCKLNDRLS